ncbi:DUF6000 family protein [Arcicella aquatica]|uniref:DUF6000 family protein n=1 Tax=Arcicella aquatica TaxID=217141 RepID=A0ABU5QQB3_9BACT|nr:DUF6000 family protein [Arcicella aquatica]MEA5259275.1 DUF6000 family protein [Arcicella aquatica]
MEHLNEIMSLLPYRNQHELSNDFREKWVIPFYMNIASERDDSWIEGVMAVRDQITPKVCLELLGNLDWRTRLVGAYFVALKDYDELIEQIGIHLLQSEVCCVGHIYALVLAYFNTEKSLHYLNAYLDYYLNRSDLYYDQKVVMEALLYLDAINQTNNISKHFEHWKAFQKKQMVYKKELCTNFFENQVFILSFLKQ